MNRDHKIRIAVRGLKGFARQAAIEALCRNPARIQPKIFHRPRLQDVKLRNRRDRQRREVTVAFRLTYEQYKRLRSEARASDVPMTKLAMIRLFGEA